MRDSFDDESYCELIQRLSRSHRLLRFADAADGFPREPIVILRHDVDYSPEAALRLAGLEADRGWRASYFLLPSSAYYNLLAPEHAGVARRLVELGHEVGLHYDLGSFGPFPRESWQELLRAQARLLEQLACAPVRAIALHQPGLNGGDPFRGHAGFLNAYDDRFFREITYLSDSCRAWRDAAWRVLDAGPLPERIQLVLHPVNWSPCDRDRETIFSDVHAAVHARIERARVLLMSQIGRHAAVLEHEARRLGDAGDRLAR